MKFVYTGNESMSRRTFIFYSASKNFKFNDISMAVIPVYTFCINAVIFRFNSIGQKFYDYRYTLNFMNVS